MSIGIRAGGFRAALICQTLGRATSQSLPLGHVTLWGLSALVCSSITHGTVLIRVTLPLSFKTFDRHDERRFYNYTDGTLNCAVLTFGDM